MNKRWIRGAISLAALVGLVWILSRIGWAVVVLRLGQVGIGGFALLCLAGIVEAAFDGAALNVAASGRVGYVSALLINQEGAAVNLLLPGEAGEVLKASLLAKYLPPREATSVVVVWNMAFRLAKSLVILATACAAFVFLPASRTAATWAVGLAAGNLSLYYVLNAILKRRLIGRVLSNVKYPAFARFVDHVREAEERAAGFSGHRPREYAGIAVLQACARCAGITTWWLAIHLLDLGYSFPLCLLIYALTELATYAVALLPTKIGTTEGSTYLIFEFLKLQGPFGAIIQIVMRIKQLAQLSFFLVAGIGLRLRKGDPATTPSDFNVTM
jgi:hypothetical protein